MSAAFWPSPAARIAVEPPATFHEAIQFMHLVLLAGWEAEDHGQTCYGRLDQHHEGDFFVGRLELARHFPGNERGTAETAEDVGAMRLHGAQCNFQLFH